MECDCQVRPPLHFFCKCLPHRTVLNDHDQHHVLVPLTRFYFVDYIVLLMLTVALVVSEMSVPYTRFIFHKDDQVSTSLAFNSPLFAYAPAADINHHLRGIFQ